MKRVVLKEPAHGYDKYVFDIETVPIPTLSPGQVLVKVDSAAINPSDYQGWEFVDPSECPKPLGNECAGTIVKTCESPGREAGQRVGIFGLKNGQGAYSEYVVANSMGEVYSMPNDLPIENAASFFINPTTVLGILDTAKCECGSNSLIHTAAASQLGQMLVKIAPEKGVEIINVVRRAEHVELLKGLGAKHIVNSSDKDWQEQLKAKAEELDCSVGFDCVAGEMPGILLDVLPYGGTCFTYGGLEGYINKVNPRRLIYEKKSMKGFYLKDWIFKGGQEQMMPRMVSATKEVASGLNGGWSSSQFTDTTIETFRDDFVSHVMGRKTSQKLRLRF